MHNRHYSVDHRADSVMVGTPRLAECLMAMISARTATVGTVTPEELAVLRQGFERYFPLDPSPAFGEMLSAIDEAEREACWSGRAGTHALQ